MADVRIPAAPPPLRGADLRGAAGRGSRVVEVRGDDRALVDLVDRDRGRAETTTGILLRSVEAAHWASPENVAVTVMTAGPEPTAVTRPFGRGDGGGGRSRRTEGETLRAQHRGLDDAAANRGGVEVNVCRGPAESDVGWTVSDRDAGRKRADIDRHGLLSVVWRARARARGRHVMVAMPGPTAVTTPVVAFTVATDGVLVANARVSVTPVPACCTFGVIVIVWPTARFACCGETVRLLIAAVCDDTVTCAAICWPVEAVAVIVLLPAATAVTRQVLPCSVAVATVGVPDVHVVIDGGVSCCHRWLVRT